LVTGSTATSVLLEDLLIASSAVTGNLESTTLPIGLSVENNGDTTLRRVRVIGCSGPGDQGLSVNINVSRQGLLRVEDVLVAHGQTQGLLIVLRRFATALVDHVTVTGHREYGLRFGTEDGGTAQLENSIIYNAGPSGAELDYSPESVTIGVENFVGMDPRFVSPAADDYELQSGSLAIDAGDETFPRFGSLDAKHRPRVVGLRTDLGAFERRGVFGDNFESGDTGGWGLALPPLP
jgi:hypothetical protein